MPGESSEKKEESDERLEASDANQVRSITSNYVVLLFRGERDSDENQDEYVCHFNAIGMNAVRIPVLTFEFINIDKLTTFLENYGNISGLVFLSPRCVYAVEKALLDCSSSETILRGLRGKLIFCVGMKTAETLHNRLQLKSTLGSEQNSIGSSRGLGEYIVKNFENKITLPLFFPCSSLSDGKLPETLENHKIPVIVMHVYNTCPDPFVDEYLNISSVRNKKYRLFVFFSPSGVDSILPRISSDINENDKFVAIGKTTAEHLQECNHDVWCVSEKPNAISLRDSVYQRLREESQKLVARKKLESWLNKNMKIEMSDGRVLIGIFLCTDCHQNVILGSCMEYVKPDEDGFTEDARALGLAMVPGQHIVSICVDSP